MFASRGFRLSALMAVLVALFSFSAVGMAEARSGGSFGSRGMRTYQSAPATSTIPKATAPVQRSTTTAGTTAAGSSFGRGGLFGGFGGWILGGLLFSGLFGMMFGGGFGGFGGLLALVVQLAILFFVVRWLFGRFRQPAAAPAGGGYGYSYAPRQDWSPGGGSAGTARSRSGNRDEIGVTNADLNVFEQRLSQLQDAYSREDYDALRRITTPEVTGYLSEELGRNTAQGIRNEVYDVTLVSGDVAEAWREGSAEYATVALRYESRDVMRERATGRIVSGDTDISEKSEVWTFVRRNRGDWLLSAIQE